MKYLHKSLYTARTRTNIDEVKRGVKMIFWLCIEERFWATYYFSRERKESAAERGRKRKREKPFFFKVEYPQIKKEAASQRGRQIHTKLQNSLLAQMLHCWERDPEYPKKSFLNKNLPAFQRFVGDEPYFYFYPHKRGRPWSGRKLIWSKNVTVGIFAASDSVTECVALLLMLY